MSAHEDKIEEIYMKCVYKPHCLELGVNERLLLVSSTLLTVQHGFSKINPHSWHACVAPANMHGI